MLKLSEIDFLLTNSTLTKKRVFFSLIIPIFTDDSPVAVVFFCPLAKLDSSLSKPKSLKKSPFTTSLFSDTPVL